METIEEISKKLSKQNEILAWKLKNQLDKADKIKKLIKELYQLTQ